MKRFRGRWLAAAFGAAALLSGLVLLASQTDAQDPGFLENFRLRPSASEVAERERASGITEPIHVPPDNLPVPDAKPLRIGPYYLVPEGWVGSLEDSVPAAQPWDSLSAPPPTADNIRRSDLWKEPRPEDLPPGFSWTLVGVSSDGVGLEVRLEYSAPRPSDPAGATILDVIIGRPQALPINVPTWTGVGANVFKATTIDGHSAVIWALPDGGPDPAIQVDIFDDVTGIRYVVHTSGDVPLDDVVALTRSLYR